MAMALGETQEHMASQDAMSRVSGANLTAEAAMDVALAAMGETKEAEDPPEMSPIGALEPKQTPMSSVLAELSQSSRDAVAGQAGSLSEIAAGAGAVGDGVQSAIVGRSTSFSVHLPSTDTSGIDVQVSVMKGGERTINASVSRCEDGSYLCSYCLHTAGCHIIAVRISRNGGVGADINGSPFLVNAHGAHPAGCTAFGDGLAHAVVGLPASFTVGLNARDGQSLGMMRRSDPGQGSAKDDPSEDLVVRIVPVDEIEGWVDTGIDSESIMADVVRISRAEYRVWYTAHISGWHSISVLLGGAHIGGSPFLTEAVTSMHDSSNPPLSLQPPSLGLASPDRDATVRQSNLPHPVASSPTDPDLDFFITPEGTPEPSPRKYRP
jgi:hypothetical protein